MTQAAEEVINKFWEKEGREESAAREVARPAGVLFEEHPKWGATHIYSGNVVITHYGNDSYLLIGKVGSKMVETVNVDDLLPLWPVLKRFQKTGKLKCHSTSILVRAASTILTSLGRWLRAM